MALVLGDNFSYGGSKPLDARLKYSTTTEMKAVADATMYDGCLAYCSGTDKTYQWKSTNTVDETLGKWREFSSGGGGGTSDYSDLTNKPSIEGVTLSGNKTASDLGLAKSTDIPSTSDCYKTGDTTFTALADADYIPVYDNSASAKKKSTWSNIKSVLKTYFDTLYATVIAGTGLTKTGNEMSIKPCVSGDMSEIIDELPTVGGRTHVYSTEEQAIGQWIDGRIIYEKVITGTITGSSTITVNISDYVPDINSLIYNQILSNGIANSPTPSYNSVRPLPIYNAAGTQLRLEYTVIYPSSAKAIYTITCPLASGVDNPMPWCIIIQYTKTETT